jgi:hypothetical protein
MKISLVVLTKSTILRKTNTVGSQSQKREQSYKVEIFELTKVADWTKILSV